MLKSMKLSPFLNELTEKMGLVLDITAKERRQSEVYLEMNGQDSKNGYE